MLKRQEADVAYGVYGPVAEEIQRDPNLTLACRGQTVQWAVLTDEQYEREVTVGMTNGCAWAANLRR